MPSSSHLRGAAAVDLLLPGPDGGSTAACHCAAQLDAAVHSQCISCRALLLTPTYIAYYILLRHAQGPARTGLLALSGCTRAVLLRGELTAPAPSQQSGVAAWSNGRPGCGEHLQ